MDSDNEPYGWKDVFCHYKSLEWQGYALVWAILIAFVVVCVLHWGDLPLAPAKQTEVGRELMILVPVCFVGINLLWTILKAYLVNLAWYYLTIALFVLWYLFSHITIIVR